MALIIVKLRRLFIWSLLSIVLIFLTYSQSLTSFAKEDPVGLTQDPAVRYCLDNGGEAQRRFPAYGTNQDAYTRLAGAETFCQFTANDRSRIWVAIATLYAEEPTLAALSYLNPPAFVDDRVSPSVNPSTSYCTQLGGSSVFGSPSSTAGGGWIPEENPNSDDVISMCVFPDLSIIDAWGLMYHSNSVIRGQDLADVLRFRPDA